MNSATADGREVCIGRESLSELRTLSDARRLACPYCAGRVVLRAGSIVSPHFAHLSGANCSHCGEPETEEHRAGKAQLESWLARCLPVGNVDTEVAIVETGQRADLIIESAAGRIAIEFQCADLGERDWRYRHFLYCRAGIRTLWLLGGSRLKFVNGILRPAELERTLLRAGAPLLFFDPLGLASAAGSLARFRTRAPHARLPKGRLSVRALASEPFPWNLIDWPVRAVRSGASNLLRNSNSVLQFSHLKHSIVESRVAEWLARNYDVGVNSLPPCFGIPIRGSEAFACSPALWQAAIYYRFIDRRLGDCWLLAEVDTWARRYLPLDVSALAVLRRSVCELEAYFEAAGFLSLEQPDGSARVIADLSTLKESPDPAAAIRVMEYRRSIVWEKNRATYAVRS